MSYTPEPPLQINQPIPSGTLDIAGTMDWTRGTENFDLTVTTPTPLHYNAGCTDTVAADRRRRAPRRRHLRRDRRLHPGPLERLRQGPEIRFVAG